MSRFGVLRFALVVAILLPLLMLAHKSVAQSGSSEMITGAPVFLRAGQATQRSQVRPPNQLAAGIQSSTISVAYSGFPAQAQTAFQAAVDIWQTQISSPVVIRVSAQWTSLGTGILGSATAAKYIPNFPGAPVANTYYPIALANKLAGTDLAPNSVDIIAQFNSSFSAWYFATDGNTPSNQYDFESVVLHELGHGLGFIGSMDVMNNQGNWGAGTGMPLIYDRFAINGSNQALLNTQLFPNPSAALETQLTGDDLFFNGSQAVKAAGGAAPKLYAPSSWQDGSSYSHLDEAAYPPGNANSLMTPALNNGESVHNPGAIMLGMFADMGWNATPSQTTATRTSTSVSTSTPASTVTGTPPTATSTAIPRIGRQAYLPIIRRQSSGEASTPTVTSSVVASATVARTATNTIIATLTLIATLTSTVSSTRTATYTSTPAVFSPTLTATSTLIPNTATRTSTSTRTPSSTPTNTNTPTNTSTPTITLTPSVTRTQEPT